jgi:phytoene dehydrogenase-like protein
MLGRVAGVVFPSLLEPLISREDMRRRIADDVGWEALIERPLAELLEARVEDDVHRGVMLTDSAIGTFAAAGDPELRQNRCFLYHVIGNGTGHWDVPVGGMGAVSQSLATAGLEAGATIRTGAEVTRIQTDGERVEVSCADGTSFAGSHVLAGVAPTVLARLLGEEPPPVPEGSQLKLNMLLRRLPKLRDPAVSPELAFTGTFHIHEAYEELQRAHDEASAGKIPTLPPGEMYCHSLTDPSILSPELQAAGAQTLTLFGLHMPARLFERDPEGAKQAAVAATLESVNSVLAEPLEDCLAVDADGRPCLEAHTPPDLEAALALPRGHIFHRDLTWPFAESDEEVGRWGVETAHPNVWVCGSGARRGGCVSGIPGHNAAQAVLATLAS